MIKKLSIITYVFVLFSGMKCFGLHIRPDGWGGFYTSNVIMLPPNPPSLAQSMGTVVGCGLGYIIGKGISNLSRTMSRERKSPVYTTKKIYNHKYIRTTKNKDGGQTLYQANGSSVRIVPGE